MHDLSALFKKSTLNNSFKGIQKGNKQISHLLYADDLLVFGHATNQNVITLKNIFKGLYLLSDIQSGIVFYIGSEALLFSKAIALLLADVVLCFFTVMTLMTKSFTSFLRSIPVFLSNVVV
ncbi:hypothetical protein M5K25_017804 [Dendrobium thyrsiflorum]|uniref:Reverse transcriptase domain-containing protein n=1 Tax=Dendrobium thyrsiflorum TaxID=117978 RepID=A0ABD0UH09_DENTH